MTEKPKVSAQRAYQLRHKEQGLCILCSRKLVNATHCRIHRESYNRICRAYRASRKINA